MQKDEIDLLIKQTLQVMIDTYPPIDSEKKWRDFEKRLSAQKKKVTKKPQLLINYKSKFVFVAAMVVVILLTLSFDPNVVTGFKNEVFKWLDRTDSGDLVLSERHNPQYQLGMYEKLSWEEAQNLVVFELKYPQYLPAQFSSAPQIEVFSKEYPKSTVTIKYNGNESFLIIKQENVVFEEIRNTYVPQNMEMQKIKVRDNLEVTLINQDSTMQVFWTENLLRFTIMAKNIAEEEIIKVIEALN